MPGTGREPPASGASPRRRPKVTRRGVTFTNLGGLTGNGACGSSSTPRCR